jgi:hypothetical protein
MRIDIAQFIQDKTTSTSKSDDVNSYSRPEYRDIGHPSTNMAATTFAKTKPDVRDIAEKADHEVPSHLEFASNSDGVGDKAQDSTSEQSYAANETVGPFTSDQWEKYKNRLGQRESGNDYSKVNSIGYSGRWQLGSPALQDLGFVNAGCATRALKNPSSWTGKESISSQESFLSNQEIQNKCILQYTRMNYKALLRMKVINPGSPADEVAGYLAAAHLTGAGGARNLRNGSDGADANGTKASQYYAMMVSEFGGTNSDPISAAKASNFKQAYDAAAHNAVSSQVQPDAASFAFPSSPAAPVFPHNKMNEYESGHFKEYDSTPGFERIQERHKTGTGYEVMPDGSYRHIVVGSSYEAILGNNFILVNGTCQIIVNGDCGLKVNGSLNHSIANDYNLLVGGNYNVVVNGKKSESIDGSSLLKIVGDSAVNIGGFQNYGVDGDLSIQAASISGISHDGDISLGSAKKINMISASDSSLNIGGNFSLSANGNANILSVGNMNVVSKGNSVVGSSSGNSTFTSNGTTSVFSTGALKLQGSQINASPKVDRAEWADRGGVVRLASALGGSAGSAPAESGGGSDGGAANTLSDGTKNSKSDKISKSIEKFTPIDTSKTQSYASGDTEVKGFDKGFTYI